jgi:hypothetical protein
MANRDSGHDPEAVSLLTKLLNALSELAPARVALIQAEWPNSASMSATKLRTAIQRARATAASPCTTIAISNQCRLERSHSVRAGWLS